MFCIKWCIIRLVYAPCRMQMVEGIIYENGEQYRPQNRTLRHPMNYILKRWKLVIVNHYLPSSFKVRSKNSWALPLTSQWWSLYERSVKHNRKLNLNYRESGKLSSVFKTSRYICHQLLNFTNCGTLFMRTELVIV